MGADKLDIDIDEEPSNDLLIIAVSTDVDWRLAYNPSRRLSNAVPLMHQVCGLCGGRLLIKHLEPGSGLTARMQYHNADRPPLGSMPGLIEKLISSNQGIYISYTHRYDGREYRISTPDIVSMLGGVPMDTPSASQWMKEKIGEGLALILQEQNIE